MFCIDYHHHHNDNNNNNTLQLFSLHHHPFVLCCFRRAATTTTTTTTFLLFSLHRHRHHHHDHISTGFLLLQLHIIYPTLTLYWPYIAPHINATSTQHRSNNKKRRRRGTITESNRINHFSSRFGVLMIKRYFPTSWYFLFAAHRFVLQTHRHQLCYKTLAPAHWLFTRVWTLGSQNMEVLQKSVY